MQAAGDILLDRRIIQYHSCSEKDPISCHKLLVNTNIDRKIEGHFFMHAILSESQNLDIQSIRNFHSLFSQIQTSPLLSKKGTVQDGSNQHYCYCSFCCATPSRQCPGGKSSPLDVVSYYQFPLFLTQLNIVWTVSISATRRILQM